MAEQKVGYCEPPEHSRFKKGKSGNPKGRPKGTINMTTILKKTLSETIDVEENGEKKTISKMEAAVRKLIDEAITGDMQAFRVLSVLTQAMQDPATGKTSAELEPADQKVLAVLAQRFGSVQMGDSQ
ncbi:MAG TPA: DUF5681 domain-containing protein [Terriglobales bacterium]|nr:DUF5681 domain-containing protein [Terriglobales bacterium]